jgi:ribonuclease E
MTKHMLIDSTHAEETRVVVLDGNRLEDFDVETSTKKQLKGNIYLAKVVRVEPSLQAAFVEYGGGRHGFLAFGEIHPDYYQIPVADRQRLLQMQAEEAREQEEDDDEPESAAPTPVAQIEAGDGAEAQNLPGTDAAVRIEDGVEALNENGAEALGDKMAGGEAPVEAATRAGAEPAQPQLIAQEVKFGETRYGELTHGALDLPLFAEDMPASEAPPAEAAQSDAYPIGQPDSTSTDADADGRETDGEAEPGSETTSEAGEFGSDLDIPQNDQPPPEVLGGESDVFEGNGADEARARRSSRMLRNYRIQEVIKRRQILLIQVVKEERGTKGAALTTYISLAGRFCVLMPNSPRGGGISRKITSAADRRRLKEITAELEIPQGMGLIVRTAGAARPKPEIKRDCEYLMRLWDDIREHTMRSVAPALIYEEASLIKRTIRDVYSRDVDEVMVDGEEGWRAAHDFMRMLMPSHAKKVQLWRPNVHGGGQPLFSAHGVEAQLDAMLTPNVQLKSGGYLVINQAEALVAIDVNSGRATRERGIEETALRTNLEAADEVARQLRLRDLAGLIVIDFIDMEAKKHNTMVERRLKEALKNDRARIQVGHISHFGLMEMSRQRLRSSLAETSFVTCPHCAGLGLVRSTESAAIHVLRAIEEEGGKGRASVIMVHVANSIVMYIMNNKRDRLAEIEARTAMRVQFAADDSLLPPEIRIDRLRPQVPEADRFIAAPVAPAAPMLDAPEEDVEDIPADEPEAEAVDEPAEAKGSEEENEQRRRRRRRRRGGRRDNVAEGQRPGGADESEAGEETEASVNADEPGDEPGDAVAPAPAPAPAPAEAEPAEVNGDPAVAEQPSLDPAELDENGLPKARRRGRRGGRRRRRDTPGEASGLDAGEGFADPAEPAHVASGYAYDGPTPANPFGGQTYDIFDIMDQVEQSEVARPRPAPAPADVVSVAAEAAPAEVSAEAAPAEVSAEAAPAEVSAEAAPAEVSAEAAPADGPPGAVPAEVAPVQTSAHAAPVEGLAQGVPEAPAETAPGEVAADGGTHTTPETAPESAPPMVVQAAPPVAPKRGWWRR